MTNLDQMYVYSSPKKDWTAVDNPLEYVRRFLKANGFEEVEENSYANDRCNVVIMKLEYAVANNYGYTIYSKDHNLYWLLGVLLWYDYIDNYQIPIQ